MRSYHRHDSYLSLPLIAYFKNIFCRSLLYINIFLLINVNTKIDNFCYYGKYPSQSAGSLFKIQTRLTKYTYPTNFLYLIYIKNNSVVFLYYFLQKSVPWYGPGCFNNNNGKLSKWPRLENSVKAIKYI